MAHFARLTPDLVVIDTVVVDNADMTDENGTEQEALGIAHILRHVPAADQYGWVQCSYSNSFRGYYPGESWTWDPVAEVFVPPPGDTGTIVEP